MVWDAGKSTGDLITSSDWNDMVSDQKGHSSRHEVGGTDELDAADLSGASGTSGQVLQTDGTAASWSTISTGASISDDGTQVLSSPNNINYSSGLSVTDDGDGSATVNGQEVVAFETGHTAWADGLSSEEIHTINLQSGETFVVERIEFRQKGGGSSTSASVDVYDNGDATVVGSQNLGGTTKDAGNSTSGSLILVRINNSTGGSINASVRVVGYIDLISNFV